MDTISRVAGALRPSLFQVPGRGRHADDRGVEDPTLMPLLPLQRPIQGVVLPYN